MTLISSHLRKSRRIPEKKVTNLEYGDGISLVEYETKNGQMQMHYQTLL